MDSYGQMGLEVTKSVAYGSRLWPVV